jgi:hypothetical protein
MVDTSPRAGRIRPRIVHVVGALVALVALAGCGSLGGSTPRKTVTVTPSPAASAGGDGGSTSNPNDGGVHLSVSTGGISPGCTSSTCYYVHLNWVGLEPGRHRVQCVTDGAGIGAWSDYSITFPTAGGVDDLDCYLGYASSGFHVWVIIDGIYESNHTNWGVDFYSPE